MKRTPQPPALPARLLRAAALLMLPAAALAQTDISNVPLANTGTAVLAKPNLMFILDDSGSMDWEYMPDDMSASNAYGYRSSQCNGVAYDPSYTYSPPVRPDGTFYPDADFNAAWPDGYNPTPSPAFDSSSSLTLSSGAKTVNISGVFLNAPDAGDRVVLVSTADSSVWMMGTVTDVDFTGFGERRLSITVDRVNGSGQRNSWTVGRTTVVNLNNSRYYTYRGTQPRLAWRYTTRGVVTDTFYDECLSTEGTAPGSGVFTRVNVNNASPAALRQNYANWYSYYRKRILTMRTAAGRAFQKLDSNYRVGFASINGNGAWLNVGDYGGTQKVTFYSRLYTTQPDGGTPLRAALARVGQYYANKMSGQTADPMQYACQRNYAILSTDGYWNGEGGTQLDRSTAIGQQDAADVRPMNDGGTATTTTVVTTTMVNRSTTPGTVTQTESRQKYDPIGGVGASGCGQNTPTQVTPQTRTRSVSAEERTDTTTTTTVTTVITTVAGVSTSSTSTSGPATSATTTRTAISGNFGPWVNGTPSTQCRPFSAGTTYSATTTGPVTFTATAAPTSTLISTSTTTNGPTTVTSGGASDTLADVAWYYYATDLRRPDLNNCTVGSQNVCTNDTPSVLSEQDTLGTQRMNTITLGMGVSGTLTYRADYPNAATGAYADLKAGTRDWPVPQADEATAIDDLWHAAVNGRGRYFSAGNAETLAGALSGALNNVPTAGVAGGANGTSTRTLPSDGSGRLYETSYNANDWSGNLQAFAVDGDGNKVGSSLWSAAGGVDGKALRGTRTTDGRTVYYMHPVSGSPTLRAFTYAQLTTDGRQAAFDNFCTQAVVPAQCAGLSTANRTLANSGANLVAWLRGAATYETTNTTSPLYRARSTALGDIIGATPVFLSRPPFNYADAGYAAFKTAQASRKLVVYVPANDGMLHAFSAEGTDAGSELWAFVPSAVMSKLYRLADTAYPNNHQYYVDGSPEIGDVYINGRWRTILVGGLGAGGRAYYALDITDPLNPQALWEFSSADDADLGLSFGNPVIAKLADGTWVVILSSGHNNTSPGDGNGHLYVLNARTGALLLKLDTTAGGNAAGDATAPAGLAKLAAWVDSERDNTVKRLYGGDLRGNLWRFDIDASSNRVTRLAQMLVGSTPQPVTAAPALAQITYGTSTYPVVFVATGRYLGTNDLTDTTLQSIYAIKDPMDGSSWGNVHTSASFVEQTLSTSGGTRTITSNPVDWATKGGWRVDLPSSGERVFADIKLAGTALAVASAIPGSNSLCSSTGGTSWLYLFDSATGSAVSGRSAVGVAYPGGVLMGLTVNYAADGTPIISARGSDGGTLGPDKCTGCKPGASSGGTLRRTYWRELVN
ncbi:MAG: pilus assembly protein PilY [Burkholderiales bacterium]|nr:pilus assembly protein PilY [Burkholderiales bacterium]